MLKYRRKQVCLHWIQLIFHLRLLRLVWVIFSTRSHSLWEWGERKCILLLIPSNNDQAGNGVLFWWVLTEVEQMFFCSSADFDCIYWMLIYLINSFRKSIFIEYVFFCSWWSKKGLGSLDQINALENSGCFCIALGHSHSLLQFNYHSLCGFVFVQIYLPCETFSFPIFSLHLCIYWRKGVESRWNDVWVL